MTNEAILEDLNEPQQRAVQQVDGPLLVIAGAGSGKTRVITRRVAWMINQGIPPSSILAITFTNKAAGEMRARVADVMGRQLRDFGQLIHNGPTICTFHSLCLRILKAFSTTVGLKPNFSILDIPDQQKLVKEAIALCQLDPKRYTASQVHHLISSQKNKLITPEAFAQNAGFVEKQLAPVYAKYQHLLMKNNAVDFDDLLMHTATAFRKYPDMLAELQDRFTYMLIDEYQDTNHAQYIIAHALALKHGNICVVGDPDQSIYAWRGADIRNILDFEQDYPSASVIRLEQNYRSSKRILAIASKLIERNTQRKKKDLWTENPEGPKARLMVCADERDEAAQVTQELQNLHQQQGLSWSQMAIFYRINAMSRVMEDALRRAAVPYEIARGVEFYRRKEIKDVLAYLRVIVNPLDEVNLQRIINTPTRGVGDNSIKLMQAFAISRGVTLLQVLASAQQVAGLNKKAVKSCINLAALLARWRRLSGLHEAAGQGEGDRTLLPEAADGCFAQNIPVPFAMPELATSIQAIIEKVTKESGLEDLYKKESDEDVEGGPLANIDELINSAAEFDEENPQANLEAYLHQVSLVSDADHRGTEGAITLMTFHAAKGLEFPAVAMIGMEEGILPHERVKESPAQLEEERRLCFVGITRAQQHLLLSLANNRMVRGMHNRQMPSVFLREMPKEHLEKVESPGLSGGAGGYGGYQTSVAGRYEEAPDGPPLEPAVRKGQRVRHPIFGDGTVLDVGVMGQNTRVIVDFNSAGRKTLILEFARLTVLS